MRQAGRRAYAGQGELPGGAAAVRADAELVWVWARVGVSDACGR